MSLLDDVSIVVTPNGYKAGELYAVVPNPVYGEEEVVNGDFSDGLTGWDKSPEATLSVTNDQLDIQSLGGSGEYGYAFSTINFIAGKTYVIDLDVISTNVSIHIRVGASADFNANPDNIWGSGDIGIGSHSIIWVATNNYTYLGIGGRNDVTTLVIDNVSVKEVITASADMDVTRATAATRVDENGLVNYAEILGGDLVDNGSFTTDTDWDKTGTWSIESNYATASGNSISQYIQQDFTITNGKTYLFTYEIIENTLNGNGSSLSGSGGFVSVSLSSVIGTHQVYITADNSGAVYALKIGVSGTATTGTIKLDNVSVKEVTRDNVPRIDYTGGGCPHILAEPQRTNLVTYSEDFTDSSWSLDGSNVNLTRTPNATTSPSGEENATKLIGNNISNDPNNSYIGVNTSAAAPYTTSIFAKKGEYDYLVSGIGSYAGGYYAIFNLSNGTVSTSPTASGTTASIEDYGNGWYRCLVNTTNTGGGELLFISPSVDGTLTTNYTNTTNGIYVWGGQVENGSYATSYIPTSGSTVTRNQDIFTRDGIGSLINSTEGVLFVEMAALSTSIDSGYLSLNNGGNYQIRIGYLSGNIYIQIRINGSVPYFYSFVGTISDFNKIAVKWTVSEQKVYVNGSPVDTGVASTIFPTDTLNNMEFAVNGATPLFAKVKQLQVYDTALTDTQLAALTS